jgi:hypothetical protein
MNLSGNKFWIGVVAIIIVIVVVIMGVSKLLSVSLSYVENPETIKTFIECHKNNIPVAFHRFLRASRVSYIFDWSNEEWCDLFVIETNRNDPFTINDLVDNDRVSDFLRNKKTLRDFRVRDEDGDKLLEYILSNSRNVVVNMATTLSTKKSNYIAIRNNINLNNVSRMLFKSQDERPQLIIKNFMLENSKKDGAAKKTTARNYYDMLQ